MVVFCYRLRALLIYLSIYFSCYNCLDNIHLTEDDSEIKSACNEREYIFIATIDGNLTALDFNSGKKCWSISLDAKGFLLSSVDKVEVWENNTRVWMIPSLDGVLFKFDKSKLQPLPLNAESFLTQSAMFDQHSFTTAEKFKLVYGICRHTGEIYYKCSTDSCKTFGRGSVEDILIVEQVIQSAAASDSLTAENRWHFRVVELKIKTIPTLNTVKNGSFAQNACGEHALMIYDNLLASYDVPTMKISLANGYAGRINQSYEFTWIYKSSVPIVDVWHNSNNRVQLLDPFADDSNFFSIYSDDGKQAALLFLGSYRNQLFVKQSKVLKTKVVQNHALSKQGYFEAHFQEPKIPLSLPNNESNALALADININDHGYYFYVNFSVYENETHCIVDFKYPKFSDKFSQANYWLKLTASILFAVIPLGVFWSVRRSRKKKKFANEGTSTLELTLNAPEKIPDSSISNLDFVSRFHKDFQLVTILGKGGFGVVMEVKNKIDDCDYAVKRIQIRLKDEYKQLGSGPVMREVKALAKLDHPGVVRYFNSWVEYPPKGWQQLKDKELDIVDVSHSETCEEPLKSAEENPSKFKNDIRQDNVFAKLAENPLKPINEDFFNDTDFDYNPSSHWSNEDSTSDSNNSSNSQSEDSSLSDDSSDTLSLCDASKISEWSLYFDHGDESCDSDDGISQKTFIYPKNIALRDQRNSNTLYETALKSLTTPSIVSDIREMFNIPSELFIDKDAAYLHLKKINKYLSWRINSDYLNKLYRYIFFDPSCPDPDHSECSGWSCILDGIEPFEVTKGLVLFQKWLLSVLCVLRLAESHYHNLLVSNLSYILWEVNHLLEENICSNCLPVNSMNYSSVKIISDFFYLKRKNDDLAWPMKFICLLKFRHSIFCELNECSQSDWQLLFYNGDSNIFKKNLSLFRVWIISMLCEISVKKVFNEIIFSNLCHVLAEVNIFLQEKKDVPNHSTKKFFELYGNLLHQPKTSILLEEQKDKLLMMFCNSYLPEKVKPPSSFLKTTDESKNDVLGFLYIQMQLCRRDSLRNWLDIHSQNRNYCEVMNIFHQIVEAMAYVHAQGLMHRDLKPSNIYFSLEGLIKIGDFGLATQFEMQGLPQELMPDEHTSHCGTALYMSPEQCSKKCYNYKTDIFSLGIILYELLVPFATRAERYKAIYAARDRQFSQDFISKYFKESMLVQKLLDIDPKRRPTASEIKKHPLFQKFQNSRT